MFGTSHVDKVYSKFRELFTSVSTEEAREPMLHNKSQYLYCTLVNAEYKFVQQSLA